MNHPTRDESTQRQPRQFSLRTLMTAMVIVAAFFAGWHSREWQLRSRPKIQWMDEMGTLFTVNEDGTTDVETKSATPSSF